MCFGDQRLKSSSFMGRTIWNFPAFSWLYKHKDFKGMNTAKYIMSVSSTCHEETILDNVPVVYDYTNVFPDVQLGFTLVLRPIYHFVHC